MAGGTFPGPNDMPVSLPQAAGVGSVPAVRISTTAAETAIAEGQQAEVFSRELKQAGTHLEDMAAQDAIIKLRAAKQDLTFGEQNGFQHIKGIDATRPMADGASMVDSYAGRLRTQIDAAGKGLIGRAATLYAQRADEEMTLFKTEVASHQLEQSKVANKSLFESGTAQNITEAARNANDPAVLSVLVDRNKALARSYATRAGLDPKGFELAAGSNIVRSAIETKLASNDGPGAIKLFQAFGSQLDGADQIVVQRAIKTTQIQQNALAFVGGTVGTAVGSATGEVFAVPEHYKPQVQAASDKYGIPVQMLASTFWNESRWNPNARAVGDQAGSINPATGRPYDSVGLGQWGEQWAQGRGFNPSDPNASIDQTAKAMREYSDKYGGNVLLARLAYGWGPANVDKWLASGGDPNKIPEGAKVWLPRSAYGIADDATARAAFDRLAPALKPGVQFSYGHGVQDAAPIDPTPFIGPQPPTIVPPGAQLSNSPPTSGREPTVSQQSGIPDTREMLIGAERWKINATAKNQATYANDPAQLAANQGLINVQYEAMKSRIELTKLQLYQAVDDWMTKGGPNGGPAIDIPPAPLWDQLPWEKQQSIRANLAHNAKGKDPPDTDEAKRAWMQLNDLATDDPDTFRKLDLSVLIPLLPKARLDELQRLKNEIQKTGQKEFNVTTAESMADRTLTLAGVDTRTHGASDKDVAIRTLLHDQLKDWLARYQLEHKRAPKALEVQQQIDNMLLEGRTSKPSLFGSIFGEERQAKGPPNAKGATGDRGTLPGGQFQFTVPESERGQFYVPYERIPAAIRTKIESAPAMKELRRQIEAEVNRGNILPGFMGANRAVRLRQEAEVERAYMRYLQTQGRVP